MECPRCGAANDDSRSTCSSCFAPLKAADGSKPNMIKRDVSAKTERPRNESAPSYRPTSSTSSSSSSSGGSKAGLVVAIIVIAGLVAGWWFLLYNPSPVSAAKAYVDAKMAEAPKNQGMTVECKFDKPCTIKGSTAEVPITVVINTAGTQTPMEQTLVMNKTGSVLRKQWVVDEKATQEKAMEQFSKQFGAMMNGMMKAMGNAMGGSEKSAVGGMKQRL